MEKTTIAATMAVLVGIILVGAVLVPTIDLQTKETNNIVNPGAGDLRFEYYSVPTAYTQSASYDSEDSELTIGAQTVAAETMICWASDLGSIVYSDGSFFLLADNSGTTVAADLGTAYSLTATDSEVTVADGDGTVYTGAPAWSYVPEASGIFGYYDAAGSDIGSFPLAAAGLFVGISTYNDLATEEGLEMDAEVSSGNVVEDVNWIFTE